MGAALRRDANRVPATKVNRWLLSACSFQKSMAHELYRSFLILGLVIQNKLVISMSGFPVVGPLFSIFGFFSISWISSFYCFE